MEINNANMFISLIYEKTDFSFGSLFKYIKHRIKLNRFAKRIMKGSPTFHVLWEMADFIKISNNIFFTLNKSNYLYSSVNYDEGCNGFRVTDTDNNIKVTIKLIKDTNKVLLEAENIRIKTKITMSFTDNKWDDTPSMYDELILDQIIECINRRVMEQFWHCYNKD